MPAVNDDHELAADDHTNTARASTRDALAWFDPRPAREWVWPRRRRPTLRLA
jgi:hypothetical protein